MNDDKSGIKHISASTNLLRYAKKKAPSWMHSELHELVAKMREDFDEADIKRGKGSFGFYIGKLKGVPLFTIKRWLAEIADSPKLDTSEARRRVFWWYWREYKKTSEKRM